jgi:hypothetical protein
MSIELLKNDSFAIYGSDLLLLNTQKLPLKQLISDYSHVKILKFNNENKLALATAGKISIIETDLYSVVGQVITRKNCSCMAWSALNKNILLTGFEKIRNDYGLMFWDVFNLNKDSNPIPIAKYGNGLQAFSATFIPQSQTAIAGLGPKWIRSFDYRGDFY